MGLDRATLQVTVALVTASLAVIVPGVAGTGASLVLSAVLVAGAGLLFAVTDGLEGRPRVLGHELGQYVSVLWAGLLVAAVTVFVFETASPGELQTLGGLLGLLGMVNYFLRPVYRAGYWVVQRVV